MLRLMLLFLATRWGETPAKTLQHWEKFTNMLVNFSSMFVNVESMLHLLGSLSRHVMWLGNVIGWYEKSSLFVIIWVGWFWAWWEDITERLHGVVNKQDFDMCVFIGNLLVFIVVCAVHRLCGNKLLVNGIFCLSVRSSFSPSHFFLEICTTQGCDDGGCGGWENVSWEIGGRPGSPALRAPGNLWIDAPRSEPLFSSAFRAPSYDSAPHSSIFSN